MTLHATSDARRSVRGALARIGLAATMVAGGTLVAPAATASTAPQSAAGSATAGRGALVSTRSYSKSTVAKHNKASDCWTIVDGKVYNLTKFVGQAPGRAGSGSSACAAAMPPRPSTASTAAAAVRARSC